MYFNTDEEESNFNSGFLEERIEIMESSQYRRRHIAIENSLIQINNVSEISSIEADEVGVPSLHPVDERNPVTEMEKENTESSNVIKLILFRKILW